MRKPILIVMAIILFGCDPGTVREEFYRGEVKHLHAEGNRAYKAGEYDEAESLFRRVLALAPQYLPAHISMGNISLARGNSDEAKRKYQYALERDPSLREQIEPLLAYAVTMPKAASKSGGPTLAELQQVLTKTGGEDLGELRALAQSLAKPMDWMNSRYRAESNVTRSISGRLFALYRGNHLDACPQCIVFTACWFAERAGPDHWPLLEDAIRKTGDGVLRMTLAYQLARSLERAGERQRAMTAYLTLLPDPRAKARLARLD